MLTEAQERLLKLHREIDLNARTSPLPFVSGWETTHNVSYERLAPLSSDEFAYRSTYDYNFMADDEILAEKIRQFHRAVDGGFPDGCDVFVGAGSSPLLSSTLVLLSDLGFREVHYLAPIYHAYYQIAKILGLSMTGVGEALSEAGEHRVADALPDRRCVLLVTDPSWISGRSFSAGFHAGLAEWQRRTGSIVIVDGTFQYTKWETMGREESAALVPEQTFRIVCPTKSLCVHGVRCAYMILPRTYTEDFGWFYCKMVAASSIFDVGAAHLLIDQLSSPRNNRDLVDVVRGRYAGLRERGVVKEAVVEPNCTYYVFGATGFDLSSVLFMNSSYFELPYPEEYIRVNLLSPHVASLLAAD